MPEIREVSEPDNADYPVLMGDYDSARVAGARWESTPLASGTPLLPPTPVFAKLDPAVADEEVARLAAPVSEA